MADKVFNHRQLQLVSHKLNGFVSKQVFMPEMKWNTFIPVMPVSKREGVFYVEKEKGLFELADRVASGEWANYNTEDWTSSSYKVEDYARGFQATKDELEEADNELNLLQMRTRRAFKNVELRKEYEALSLAFLTASVLTIYTAPAVWVKTTTNLPNNSTSIVQHLVEAKRKIGSATNYTIMANKLLLGGKVANVIGIHNDFYDIDKYTNSGIYRRSGIPKVIQGLDVTEIDSVYMPHSERIKSSQTKSSMISDQAIVAYVNMNDPEDTWITCFQKHPKRVMIRENNEKVIAGEVNESYQFKVLNSNYAVLIDNIEG